MKEVVKCNLPSADHIDQNQCWFLAFSSDRRIQYTQCATYIELIHLDDVTEIGPKKFPSANDGTFIFRVKQKRENYSFWLIV